jgi:hypothetical protein
MTTVGGRFWVMFIEIGSAELTFCTCKSDGKFGDVAQMRSNLSQGYLTIKFPPASTLDSKTKRLETSHPSTYIPSSSLLNSIPEINGS